MKHLPFLLLLLCPLQLMAQKEFKSYINTNTTELKSIDLNYENDDDLTPIKNAIGEAQVVMLGEQDHGDAATFLMKARLVKYLHEECGFDIIAFESNFYDLQGAFEKDSLNFQDAYEDIFPIWTKCGECEPIFSYIKETQQSENPLFITGFDMQNYFNEEYSPNFKQFISENNLKIQEEEKFFEVLDTLTKNNNPTTFNEEEWNTFFTTIEKLQNTYTKDNFWKQELHNLKGFAEMRKSTKFDNTLNIRDTYMADNLIWLAEKRFPNKKIIVWAHNFHIARGLGPKKVSLGNEAYKSLGDKMYSIAFTSLEGSTGWAFKTSENYKVMPPHKIALERRIEDLGYEQAFLDLKSFNGKRTKFTMKGLKHWSEKRNWFNIFDSVIYIKTMFPCTKEEEVMLIN
ncbi:erythromycin esterase family protein [Sediminitomix flava]|uniref:Erythromycin esterase n=1 Tax=Sediminitomix flava TaxID=379075 RepID=A0A315ZBQ6_SEDFL|nr:erythromycin esterase family protein [Sediminitomix flava]PWJ43005.1 erythromycin esterase [Sediminitomix flava]